MSKSNLLPENPCKKFIQFKGDTGQFFFYNRETEKKEEILAPLFFVVLDELSTVTGFNDDFKCGIYSNEVHFISREPLTVRTFKGGLTKAGFYSTIKDSIKAMGGKYTKSVYAILIHKDKSTELVNFHFHGGALTEWIGKKINASRFIIGISEFRQEKKGAIKYSVPVFKPYKLDEETDKKAIAMDRVLQQYLAEYASRQLEREEAMPNPLLGSPAETPEAPATPTPDNSMSEDDWAALQSDPDYIASQTNDNGPVEADDLPY